MSINLNKNQLRTALEVPPYYELPVSYVVFKDGDLVKAQNGHTGRIDFSDSDPAAVFQSVLNVADGVNPHVIYIKGCANVDFGTQTITKSYVSIIADNFNQGDSNVGIPRFTKITIDATSGSVISLYFRGLLIRQLDFYANGNPICYEKVENCLFRVTATYGYKGIYFRGSSYIDMAYFVDCAIMDWADQSTNRQGAITFEATHAGTGQIYFERLYYKPRTNNAVMLCYDGGQSQPPVVFSHLNIPNFQTGVKVVHIKDGGKCMWLDIHDSFFEMHNDVTIFNIDDGTTSSNMLFHCLFHHNQIEISSGTTTLINNLADEGDWDTRWGRRNGFFAHDNHVNGNTFAIGTTGANDNFTFVLHNYDGYRTVNSGTATFSGNGSQTQFTIPHGLIGIPKSYRVEAGSSDAKGDKYVTADDTNLTVTFATAPPSGTNNVVLVWQAEM
jgi:hypothetical protein